jgi:hypothetical protein
MKRGMRYVPLIDPGISGGEEAGKYAPYVDGIEQDIFIKDGTGKPFVGKVWNPVSTVWPDFSHPNVTHYWMSQLDGFHKVVDFDGAWIVSYLTINEKSSPKINRYNYRYKCYIYIGYERALKLLGRD